MGTNSVWREPRSPTIQRKEEAFATNRALAEEIPVPKNGGQPTIRRKEEAFATSQAPAEGSPVPKSRSRPTIRRKEEAFATNRAPAEGSPAQPKLRHLPQLGLVFRILVVSIVRR